MTFTLEMLKKALSGGPDPNVNYDLPNNGVLDIDVEGDPRIHAWYIKGILGGATYMIVSCEGDGTEIYPPTLITARGNLEYIRHKIEGGGHILEEHDLTKAYVRGGNVNRC
jgi:hypothetical protein